MDEMLTGVPDPERIELLTAFAEGVRQGHYSNSPRVRAGTVQVALRAIGKTFEMDGLPNPTYRSEGKYWLQIERLIEAYRRQDGPAHHKLAIPVSLVTYLHRPRHGLRLRQSQAICDMSSIAFYYLLRVGEYTSHRRNDRRRTNNSAPATLPSTTPHYTIIPNTAPLEMLYTATKAVMRITNQKNGTRGSRISHDASGTKACPVRALARRVSLHHVSPTMHRN